MRGRLSVLLMVALWVPGAGWAADEVIPLESPAYFVQAAGGYAYRALGAASGAGQSRPREEIQVWEAGGLLTVPIAIGLGIRIEASGEGGTLRYQSGGRFETVGAGGEAQLFWRDPTKGQFGLGYGYYWSAPQTTSVVDSIRIQSLPVYAAIYMPSMNGAAVDWNASFRYDFLSLQSTTGSRNEWAYEARFGSTWYINDVASFEGAVRYERRLADEQEDILEGDFAIEILIPTGGERHFASVSLDGGVGRAARMDLPLLPSTSLSSLTWRVGAQATIFFPGVTSLIELNRAYR